MSRISLSVDDGCASDVRVADLASKYEIPCTFYWPIENHSLAYENGYEPLDYQQALGIVKEHEIGSHTITHRHLTKISTEDAIKEIVGSKYMLERMFQTKVSKFCPPRGYTNEELTSVTLKFYESQRLTKGIGLVHVHPNSGANGNVGWKDYFRMIVERGEEDIELWGHSWEWDKFEMWAEVEDFISEIHKY